MGAIQRKPQPLQCQPKSKPMTTETEEADTGPGSTVPEPVAPSDDKELLLQRRLARIEEALGLSPLT